MKLCNLMKNGSIHLTVSSIIIFKALLVKLGHKMTGCSFNYWNTIYISSRMTQLQSSYHYSRSRLVDTCALCLPPHSQFHIPPAAFFGTGVDHCAGHIRQATGKYPAWPALPNHSHPDSSFPVSSHTKQHFYTRQWWRNVVKDYQRKGHISSLSVQGKVLL